METEREVSLPVFSQQVMAVRLNGPGPVFVHPTNLGKQVFLAFHFECKRENNNNKTLLLVLRGRKTWPSISKHKCIYLSTNGAHHCKCQVPSNYENKAQPICPTYLKFNA